MKTLGITLCTLLLAGCATTNNFTNRGQSALAYNAILSSDPGAVIGREALVGGRILSIQQADNETHVEIMISSLNTNSYPEGSGNSQQRAIVVLPKKIDTDSELIGSPLSALGIVDSVDQGNRGFTVVLIRASEYKLWKKTMRRYNNGADIHRPVGLTFSW